MTSNSLRPHWDGNKAAHQGGLQPTTANMPVIGILRVGPETRFLEMTSTVDLSTDVHQLVLRLARAIPEVATEPGRSVMEKPGSSTKRLRPL
jgi:hypothetical protein